MDLNAGLKIARNEELSLKQGTDQVSFDLLPISGKNYVAKPPVKVVHVRLGSHEFPQYII